LAALTGVKAFGASAAHFTDMTVTTVHRLEEFFRRAASLDIDKSDVRRLDEFIDRKIQDLLIAAQSRAKANGRDIVQPWDMPVTKGLQQTIHRFRELDAELSLRQYFERSLMLPPLDFAYADETEERMPDLAGGLCLALAQSFKILNPEIKNPMTEHWERAYRLFDLLL
jgi:hypothetical protein